MRIFLTIIIATFNIIAIYAQSITQDLSRDLLGQGKIVVNHSAEIERLVNATPKEDIKEANKKTEKNTSTKESDVSATAKSSATTPTTTKSDKTSVPHNSTEANAGKTNDSSSATVKKTSRAGYKTTGYRIQIYSGGNKRADRTKCERIAAQLRRSFPELPVYVNFYSPSWKCRAGNFTNYSEAQAILKEVKAMGYPDACLVKGTIVVYH